MGILSFASVKGGLSGPYKDANGQGVPGKLGQLLSRTPVGWVWAVHGVGEVVVGLVLLSQFGAALGPVRVLLSASVLVAALTTVWRGLLAGRRSTLLLATAGSGLLAGVIILLGFGLSVRAVMWIFGVFWIAAGLLELLAWFQQRAPTVQWPWISGLTLLIGVILATFPTPLVPVLTLLGSAWALILGAISLLRWLWLARHDNRLVIPPQRPSVLRRILLIGIPAILLAAPALGYGKLLLGSVSENLRQGALDAFYRVPADVTPGPPGSIIRIEPLSTPGVVGRGWRILFRSQDTHGHMTISSGVVYAPASAGSNRLVMAWAHGTIGLAPTCAPSRQATDPAISPWLNQMLEQGWVVTAPDYVGAGGTGGPDATELYLIGNEQGRDLLNGVRAARNIPEAGAGTRFAIYGHSQGGLVALTGAALAPDYAPELSLVAVGAVSAASEPAGILDQIWRSPLAGWILGPYVIYPWTRYYPNLSARDVLTTVGLNHYQEMALNNCITDVLPAVINPRMGLFFSKDPITDSAWLKALVANQAPLVPKGIPVFIGHGLADPLINPAFSAWLVTRYCAHGSSVTTHWMPGVSHGEAAIEAAPNYITWLTDIISGKPVSSDCGKPLPISPAQPFTA